MITKTTQIEDIVKDYPELIRPLMQHGIVCVVCGEPIWGNLEEVAKQKGIANIDAIIEDMNKIISEKHK